MKIPITSQIAEVQREIAIRQSVYPIQVRDKKMRPAEAELCMNRIRAVMDTLLFCQQHEADIRTYIAAKKSGSAT